MAAGIKPQHAKVRQQVRHLHGPDSQISGKRMSKRDPGPIACYLIVNVKIGDSDTGHGTQP